MRNNLTITLNPKELAAVNKWLSQMGDVDRTDTVAKAFKEGATIIKEAGRINLSARNKVNKGNLKKSFSIKVVKKKAYALSGFKRPKGAAAHLVDRGTKKRYTHAGYYRGAAKGSYFWTDAVQESGPRAINKLMDAVYKSLEEITNRNN